MDGVVILVTAVASLGTLGVAAFYWPRDTLGANKEDSDVGQAQASSNKSGLNESILARFKQLHDTGKLWQLIQEVDAHLLAHPQDAQALQVNKLRQRLDKENKDAFQQLTKQVRKDPVPPNAAELVLAFESNHQGLTPRTCSDLTDLKFFVLHESLIGGSIDSIKNELENFRTTHKNTPNEIIRKIDGYLAACRELETIHSLQPDEQEALLDKYGSVQLFAEAVQKLHTKLFKGDEFTGIESAIPDKNCSASMKAKADAVQEMMKLVPAPTFVELHEKITDLVREYLPETQLCRDVLKIVNGFQIPAALPEKDNYDAVYNCITEMLQLKSLILNTPESTQIEIENGITDFMDELNTLDNDGLLANSAVLPTSLVTAIGVFVQMLHDTVKDATVKSGLADVLKKLHPASSP